MIGRIALVAASVAFGALLGECVLRIARPNPFAHESADGVLSIRLHHARQALPIDRSLVDPSSPVVMLRTDELGYLLPSRRSAEPHATVAFLVGPTTECKALDATERWPALVSKLLEERGLHVSTLNAGNAGNTSDDAVNLLLNHIVRDRTQDALLMEAANDLRRSFG